MIIAGRAYRLLKQQSRPLLLIECGLTGPSFFFYIIQIQLLVSPLGNLLEEQNSFFATYSVARFQLVGLVWLILLVSVLAYRDMVRKICRQARQDYPFAFRLSSDPA